MKHKKEHSLLKSLQFAYKKTVANDRAIVLFSFASVPFQILNKLTDIYLIALIVDAASIGSERRLFLIALAFSIYKLISGIALAYIERQLSTRNYRLKTKFTADYADKYMNIDFDIIESTQAKDLAQRAKNSMAGDDFRYKSSVEALFSQFAGLFGNICGLFVYTGIIAVLNPLIIVLLITTSAVSYFLQKAMVHYDQRDKKRYIPLDRRIWYLIKELRDMRHAKDIRMYKMGDWLEKLFDINLAERSKLHEKRSRLQYCQLVLLNIINTAFTGYIYYFLISHCISGSIDTSQFLLYFGLITGFNGWLMSVTDGFEALHATLLNIDDLRCFHGIPTAEAVKTFTSSDKAAIEFKNVCFGYSANTDIIKNMSFTVSEGEKIAVVGLNGAGKTTLVKLICGLYKPRSGCIFIDGQDINAYTRDELFDKFAAVFQDVYILPTTIERNIALSSVIDCKRLEQSLEISGLKSKTNTLQDGVKTILVKGVLENAIELSGGETQKLALARAIYKGGEILILDEPTAALDPIAENEMYQKYNRITENKTSIFISHRLSSTRFCDRIFYLENGIITECGTHDELIKLGGSYAHLYEVQSHYYRDEKGETP